MPASVLLSLLLSLAPAQAMAGHDNGCAATPSPPPAGLERWADKAALEAGASAARAATLPVGRAVDATLLPVASVRYAAAPEKPVAAGTSGGVFAFTVAKPGRYRVALGAGAWVDVVRGTTAVASAAHGHGPACSGIRKMVDFDLPAGRYLLQIAGNAAAKLPMMVAKLPG